MSNNSNLHKAKKARNDEFYTMLSDIENELRHYRDHFKGKVVYCNCDDARESNFFKYFSMNFEFLGLKKLISTGYKKDGRGVKLVYDGDRNGNRTVDDEEVQVTELEGDGDFRSEECVKLLDEADIVVTNPPFSLFREYVAQLVGHGKKFLIIGNMNALKYKEIFPLIKANKIWVGHNFNKTMEFRLDESYERWNEIRDGFKYGKVPAIAWFTNLDVKKHHEKLVLTEKYDPAKYPKYDNYDAINVDKTVDIPKDYDGVMGVPITFLDKYNPEQFEIVGELNHGSDNEFDYATPMIDGKVKYMRILIRRKPGKKMKQDNMNKDAAEVQAQQKKPRKKIVIKRRLSQRAKGEQRNIYLDKDEFAAEIAKWKQSAEKVEDRRVHDRLALMIYSIPQHMLRSTCFRGYDHHLKEDMAMNAYVKIVKNLKNYNPDHGSSAFKYFSTCAYFAFIETIMRYYKHKNFLERLTEAVKSRMKELGISRSDLDDLAV